MRHLFSNYATFISFWFPSRSLRNGLSTLLSGQLNFNQGQLCLLPPAEGAAGGEKGRREQQERRVYSLWWTTQWRVTKPSHSETIICGFSHSRDCFQHILWKVFPELRFSVSQSNWTKPSATIKHTGINSLYLSLPLCFFFFFCKY